jgi:hypothetical protein
VPICKVVHPFENAVMTRDDLHQVVMEHNFDWITIGKQLDLDPYEARQLYTRQCGNSVVQEESLPRSSSLESSYCEPKQTPKAAKKLVLDDDSDVSLSMYSLCF